MVIKAKQNKILTRSKKYSYFSSPKTFLSDFRTWSEGSRQTMRSALPANQLTFVTRVTRDKVLHVHPSAQACSSKQDGVLLARGRISLDNVGAGDLEVLGSERTGHGECGVVARVVSIPWLGLGNMLHSMAMIAYL